jgi:hypothetical protein
LIDDASNTVSIHSKCSSWGGDCVGASDGSLYIISAHKHLFKVDLSNMKATHLGHVAGMPATFTTNGLVVNDKNELIVSSAYPSEGMYKFTLSNLNAEFVASPIAKNFSVSDMANANLLNVSSPKQTPIEQVTAKPAATPQPGAIAVSVFPNPVTNGQFSLTFSDVAEGNYVINLLDQNGRVVLTKRLVLANENQVEKVNLPKATKKGLYMVRVINSNASEVFSSKLVVQ